MKGNTEGLTFPLECFQCISCPKDTCKQVLGNIYRETLLWRYQKAQFSVPKTTSKRSIILRQMSRVIQVYHSCSRKQGLFIYYFWVTAWLQPETCRKTKCISRLIFFDAQKSGNLESKYSYKANRVRGLQTYLKWFTLIIWGIYLLKATNYQLMFCYQNTTY